LRKLIALSVLAVVMAATSTAHATTLRLWHKPWSQMTTRQKTNYLKRQIWHDRSIIRYQRNHGGFTGVEVRWAHQSLRIAAHSLVKMRQTAHVVGGSDLGAWMCIHKYEGSWTDAGDPYWGGLQMDRTFMATYGSDFIREFHGLANVWPVWAQIQAARRARVTRGYSPWPKTAHLCGLY
jgi:hypothetical protein